MISVKYKFVIEDVDRHGNVRLYLRKPGQPKIRLRHPSNSPEFAAEYEAAVKSGKARPAPADTYKRSKPGTWRWLCEQHFASGEFRQLEQSTQRVRRQVLEHTFDEPRKPGAVETFGDCPLAYMTTKAIVVLRDRKGDRLAAANNRVKAINRIFTWALAQVPPLVSSNPARDVARLRSGSLGHHSWTVAEVEKYEARHPKGTQARLALALLLYTGQRRSDVTLLGRQHARDGWLRFTQYKNRRRNPVTLEIPIVPVLQEYLDAAPPGSLTYLISRRGKPYDFSTFGKKFRLWCDQAGLPHCSAHGLRKAGAVRAAENGATAHQLMAIFGWRTLSEAERYTKAAEQKRMAGGAMQLLSRTERG